MSKSMTYGTALVLFCGVAAMPMGSTASAQTANNVICNKCVGASDLGKSAVTKSKIAKKAVTTSRIAPGAVKTSRIGNGQVSTAKLAPGAVTASRIGAGAVTASHIAAGAVGTAKIGDGQVTVGKIGANAVTFAKLAADAVFKQTVVVSPAGPTASDNCSELQAAIAGITDASAAKPYVILLEPGIYDCGASAVVMKPNVDLAGSGRNITHIQGADLSGFGLVQMAANTELRDLSVTNSLGGASTLSIAVADQSASPGLKVLNVSATATGGTTSNIGVNFNDSTCGSDCGRALSQVTAMADGGLFAFGIIDFNATDLKIINTVGQGMNGSNFAWGMVTNTSIVFAQGSRFVGDGAVAAQTSSSVKIVHSQLGGGTSASGGSSITCFGTFNEGLLGVSC